MKFELLDRSIRTGTRYTPASPNIMGFHITKDLTTDSSQEEILLKVISDNQKSDKESKESKESTTKHSTKRSKKTRGAYYADWSTLLLDI